MATKGVNINKIGGAGLMESRQILSAWINAVTSDAKDCSQAVVVVVSALEGVTRLLDAFYKIAESGENKEKQNELIDKLIAVHFEMIDRLIPEDANFSISYSARAKAEIKGLVRDVKEYPQIRGFSSLNHAKILAYGERMSSVVFQCFLRSEDIKNDLVDARNMILCSGDPLKATVIMEDTLRRIKHHFFYRGLPLPIEGELLPMITQGYIAQNLSHCDVVMGYDSSDLTAALIARALSEVFNGKDETISIRYWKDVDGVLIDPLDPEKGIHPILDYQGYLDLNSCGPVLKEAVEVLHGTRTVAEVRTFKNLKKPGTVIVPVCVKKPEMV